MRRIKDAILLRASALPLAQRRLRHGHFDANLSVCIALAHEDLHK
jgi:hypothetical protein